MTRCPAPPYVDRCPPIQTYTVGGTQYVAYLFCDKGTGEQVLTVFQFCDGVPSGSPTYYDPVTGDVYTPVGTVGICNEADFEQTVFCDTSVTPPKPFISRVVFTDDMDIVADLTGTFELDAITPYIPVGPVTVCGGDTVDTEVVGSICEVNPAGDIVGYFWHRPQYRGTVFIGSELAGYKIASPTVWLDPYDLDPGNTAGTCESTILPPQPFCFKGSVTAPQDFPGRSFSGTLSIARGFTVDSVIVGGTTYALSITWSVLDLTGVAFATALQNAIQNKIPGSTVTIAPVGVSPCTVTPQNFSINVACIKQTVAPVSIDIKYDGGTDPIQNAGFQTGTPIVAVTQVKRQDNGGNIFCTNVANRGWETNDPNGMFEIWPPGFLGITPTPRGTQIQEINAFSVDTIWQTFVVPADGTYTLKATVGGRDATQPIVVRLSSGDTNASGTGDKLNVTVNATSVTGGTGKPWTNFTQNVFLTAGTYTLSLKGPPTGAAVGGLFTDLRLYTTLAGQIKSLTPDNTCLVTETVTTQTTDCQFWQPVVNASNKIVAWNNPETGVTLSNAGFWAQVPAPSCCTSSDGGSTEITAPNLLEWYPVCGIVSGVPTKLIRQLILDQSGGGISEQFIGNGGSVVVPDSWTLGDCSSTSDVVISCNDVEKIALSYGTEMLINGDLSQSTGTGATSNPVVGWTTSYTPVDNLYAVGAGTYALFNTDAGDVTGGSFYGSMVKALTVNSMAVNVGPDTTQPIISWANIYLENGKTYSLEVDAAIMNPPFGVSIYVDGVEILPVTAPAVRGVWERTQTIFTYTGSTGYHTVSLNSNTGVAAGNDHSFDNFSLRNAFPANTEVITTVSYDAVVRAVVDQIVKIVGCNDDRRDQLLAEISQLLSNQTSSQIEVICRCDDVDGDGTPEVGYKSVISISSTGDVTILANYDQSMSSRYIPVAPGTCGVPGDELVRVVPEYKVLSGVGTWTLNADSVSPTISVSFMVLRVGNSANPPTVTSKSGTSPLYLGQSLTWSSVYGRDVAGLKPPLVLTTRANDLVAVNWSEESI